MEPDVPFLEVEGLSKGYPGVIALQGASVSIRAGEVVGLVGKNGAGKSTLIKILAGAVAPDAGTIRINGVEQSIGSPHAATEAGLAFVHQELGGVADLSVAENIFLGFGYARRGPFVAWSRLRREAQEVLDRLGSDISPAAPMGSLTKVQQRIVMIAHGLVHKAGLIALDEPSAALSQEEIDHLHAVIAKLSAEGIAVVYVSHRLDEILAITSRVVVMRDGALVARHPTAELDRAKLVHLVTGENQDLNLGRDQRGRPPLAPDAEVVMEVREVTSPALRGPISFALHRGEILGIAGLVGAGRTELLRALIGADTGASAQIKLGGREMRIRSERQAVREGLILLPEDRKGEGNVLNWSVRENLSLATLPQFRAVPWAPVPSARKERTMALERIDELQILTPSDEARVSQLSGGNQQKVLVGKWLGHASQVLMFDEPTQGIDVGAKEEIFENMESLAMAGRGIIFVSSDLSEIVTVCDRVLVLREGELVSELSPPDIGDKQILEACYA